MSWRAARELLAGLERGDFEQIEERLGRIRHYIDLAETVPAESLRGPALHHREQIELLAGITDNLCRALDGIREKVSKELQQVGADRNLLRHLVASGLAAESGAAALLPL